MYLFAQRLIRHVLCLLITDRSYMGLLYCDGPSPVGAAPASSWKQQEREQEDLALTNVPSKRWSSLSITLSTWYDLGKSDELHHRPKMPQSLGSPRSSSTHRSDCCSAPHYGLRGERCFWKRGLKFCELELGLTLRWIHLSPVATVFFLVSHLLPPASW